MSTETGDAPLIVTRDGPLAVVTMVKRPHNLVGPDLLNAVIEAMEAAIAEGSRAILLRSGLRNFSAGADPAQFAARSSGSTGSFDAAAYLRRLELLPAPIVAAVNGVCIGGGLELALACDIIVASASAKLGSVETTLGLNPLMGAVQRQVQRIGMARAKEMSLLGRRYDPQTLERWGLINLVLPDDTFEAGALALASELAHGPTVALAATKTLAHLAANEGVAAADGAMAEIAKPIWASEDLRIGLESLQKNGPGLARFVGR